MFEKNGYHKAIPEQSKNVQRMFEITPTSLQDALLIQLPCSQDERGSFVKTFQESKLLAQNINFQLKESYFSFSQKNVIRGMHFQLPPKQHAKIVFCPQGEILDVLLDLRTESPSFGQHFSVTLSAQNNVALYIPEGFAHGFQALQDHSMTYYLVSSEYNPEADTGIQWDSFGMDWLLTGPPILSERDLSFVPFSDFKSPF